MNAEFFAAIEEIEKEKGIPKSYMIEKINQALLAAFKKDNPSAADNVAVIVDEESPLDPGEHPAVTLVRVENESLWELAKKYHSSVEKISSLNDTAELRGKLLLIPRVI